MEPECKNCNHNARFPFSGMYSRPLYWHRAKERRHEYWHYRLQHASSNSDTVLGEPYHANDHTHRYSESDSDTYEHHRNTADSTGANVSTDSCSNGTTNTNTNSATHTSTDSNADAVTDADADADADTDADSNADTDAVTDADSDAVTDADSNAVTDSNTGINAYFDTNTNHRYSIN